MDWYYALNNQRAGPVSTEKLEKLLQSGVITSQTLVWHDGMADWQPYAAIYSAPPVFDVTNCTNCGKSFQKSEMITYQGNWICAACKPIFVQKLKEGVFVPKTGAWRSGKILVMTREAVLPEACVKCNATDHTRRLTRNLYWHHPAVYLAILLNLLIYAIIALSVRQQARIEVGICERHRSLRMWTILVCWLMLPAGIGLLVLGAKFNSVVLCISGVLLPLIALFYGVIRTRVVYATRIDKQFIRLKGACPEYLAAFPEWTAPV
jgi:hypothetical protein